MRQKDRNANLSEYVFGKLPPHEPDLEQAVLGACLIDTDALPAVLDILRPESFYSEPNRAVYSACLDLYAAGSPIDILTVSHRMRESGTIEQIGGSSYLVEITNRVASTANLEYHARIVAQKALLRSMIATANRTIQEAYDDSADAFALMQETQKALFDLANFGGRLPESVGRISIDVIKRAGEAMGKKDGITGIPCGLRAVDKTTGGWQPSDLIILAARPGMGKTAFVLNAAFHAAQAGHPVAFFSMEMSKDQLVQRIISSRTGISGIDIRNGRITPDDLSKMTQAAEDLAAVPLIIDDTPGLSIFELRAKVRRLKMQHGVQMVIIDYLQLMSGADRRSGQNREQEISEISRGCKNLAKELNVPVIALSQLSRAVETRGGAKRPMLSDLRESGAIEQDADMVVFLYRPEYYGIEIDESGGGTAGVCELIIAKHRHGALDDIGLNFEAKTTTFRDLSAAAPAFAPAPVDYSIPASARPGLDADIPF